METAMLNASMHSRRVLSLVLTVLALVASVLSAETSSSATSLCMGVATRLG
jgi:hypothetical protein